MENGVGKYISYRPFNDTLLSPRYNLNYYDGTGDRSPPHLLIKRQRERGGFIGRPLSAAKKDKAATGGITFPDIVSISHLHQDAAGKFYDVERCDRYQVVLEPEISNPDY